MPPIGAIETTSRMSAAHFIDRTETTRVPWRGIWLWFIPLADPLEVLRGGKGGARDATRARDPGGARDATGTLRHDR